jgi:plastocyanin
MRRALWSLLVPAVLAGCADTDVPTAAVNETAVPIDVSAADVKSSVVVRFGDPNAGSPFPPADGHDASIHAKDRLTPRTVVIAAGGTVTFEVMPVHRVAIYDDGVQPSDISLANLEPAPFLGIPGFQINDPNNRLFLEAPGAFVSVRTVEYTFDTPGRYLVICVTTPHFVEGDMYGWVIVK